MESLWEPCSLYGSEFELRSTYPRTQATTLWKEFCCIGTAATQVFWSLGHGDVRAWKNRDSPLLHDYAYVYDVVDGLILPAMGVLQKSVVKVLRMSVLMRADCIRVHRSELVRKDFKKFDIRLTDDVGLEFALPLAAAKWEVKVGPVIVRRKRKLESAERGALGDLLKLDRPVKRQKQEPGCKVCICPIIWFCHSISSVVSGCECHTRVTRVNLGRAVWRQR